MAVQVKQRRPGGKWQVYVCHNGKEKWIPVGCEAAARAVAEKVEIRIAMQELGFMEPKPKQHKFKEASDIFLAEFQKRINNNETTDSTLVRYNGVLNNFILPHFGNTELSTITKHMVFNYLHDSGASVSKVELALIILKEVFTHARWQEWMEHDALLDVRDMLKLKKPAKKKFKIFSHVEVEKILKTCNQDMFYLLAFRTGCRLGELLALTWQDVDFKAGTIEINKSFRAGVVGKPKTANGYRTIRLSDAVLAVLKKNAGIGKALVFAGRNGRHISQNTIRNRWIKLLRDAGVEYRKFHLIRHTTISHLLAAGVKPIEVSKMAGHHASSFTMDVYGHAVPDEGEAISTALEANG
jgi:integrase